MHQLQFPVPEEVFFGQHFNPLEWKTTGWKMSCGGNSAEETKRERELRAMKPQKVNNVECCFVLLMYFTKLQNLSFAEKCRKVRV